MKKNGTFGTALGILMAFGMGAPDSSWAVEFPPPRPTPTPVDHNMPPLPKPGRFTKHVDQKFLYELSKREFSRELVEFSGNQGDNFFDNSFRGNEFVSGPASGVGDLFGVGAKVGVGMKFSRVPRADKKGEGEWANHFPARATGPNAMSCIECHNAPAHDGGGFTAWNVVRDPLHTGDLGKMIERQTTHLFGMGAIQLLAEEMTDELQAILKDMKAKACEGGGGARRRRGHRCGREWRHEKAHRQGHRLRQAHGEEIQGSARSRL